MATKPDFLLSIYLRGGADGLTFLPTYGLGSYQNRTHTQLHPPGSSEPVQADALIPGTSATPAIGISKALEPLSEFYETGKLSFVHSVGSLDETRSHFSQQFYTEMGWLSGSPNKDPRGLWGRYLESVPAVSTISTRGISLTSTLADYFRLSTESTPVPNPLKYTFPGKAPFKTARKVLLGSLYTSPVAEFTDSFDSMLSTIDSVQALISSGYTSGGAISYTESPFGNKLKYAAQFARSMDGPEIVHVDMGGWDTHANQGVDPSIDGGGMYWNMRDLADNLAAFLADMATNDVRDVTTLVMSEFGRSLDENVSRGTDHGRGGVAIVAGENLQTTAAGKGKVVFDLDAMNQLATGNDLPVGIDIRDIQAEILQKRMGLNPGLFGSVFNSGDLVTEDYKLFHPL